MQKEVKRAIDLTSMRVISADDLLGMNPDRYQEVRRAGARAKKWQQSNFACDECGHYVYAPRRPTRVPFWQHHVGAPKSCPWWGGNPSSIDAVSARQFGGAQESALHRKIKTQVGQLLEADKRTESGSVKVDEYLVKDDGKRKPDVRANYDGKDIAFEIQLATTQLPIIMKREEFYEENNYRLLWLTWRFDPVPQNKMRTSFEDIFYSHNKSIFSLDSETLSLSLEKNEFVLRAYWIAGDVWNVKLMYLSDLNWAIIYLTQ